MTRINLIPVEELSDQHLLAEYRELPRIVNGVLEHTFKSKIVPKHYVLGKGHILFFTNKLFFLANRYELIFNELKFRGFNLDTKFTPNDMLQKVKNSDYKEDANYIFSEQDIALSRQRILEKISKKPFWYKWTHRIVPPNSDAFRS